MFGTRGRTDSKHLGDAFRGFTPPNGAQIASAISRTYAVSRRPYDTNKNTHLRRRVLLFGTRGRTRTGTLLRAGDFESPVSTNFTTLALLL